MLKVNRLCSCCQVQITNENITVIGDNEIGIWYNCNFCNSTMLESKHISMSEQIIKHIRNNYKQILGN